MTLHARCIWFFVGHAFISLLLAAGFSLTAHLDALASQRAVWVLCSLGLLAYFLAGFLMARARGWAPANRWTARWSVLLPALAFWGGAVLVYALFRLDMSRLGHHLTLLKQVTGCLAPVSYLFVGLLAITLPSAQDAAFLPSVLLAGFLPGLLFHLGTVKRGVRL